MLPGAEYGLFTEHLLGGLRGGVASDDGLVRIFDLFEYLQPRVTKAHPHQHPIFKAELEENFPMALFRGGTRGFVPRTADGFRYDAYISYVERELDATFVWDTLVPRLEQAGLKIAVSNDSLEPRVARVVGVERGIRASKRTVVVLSEGYLADHMANFENVLGANDGDPRGDVSAPAGEDRPDQRGAAAGATQPVGHARPDAFPPGRARVRSSGQLVAGTTAEALTR